MAKFGIGQSVSRSEDPRLLTGGGRYTDDIRLEGQTYAVYVRSPFAHAEIASIELDDAKAAPGVLGVFTGEDLAADGIGDIPCYTPITNRDGSTYYAPPRPALARGRVRHVGEPVVMVVAETLAQAKDAAEMVMVDLDPLPSVADTAGAVADGAPQIYDQASGNVCFDWGMGDEGETGAIFDQAAHVIELELVNNRVIANSMEGRACIASYDTARDRYDFWVSSQGVHGLQKNLANDILHVPTEKLHVMTTDVGGGFGMKIFMYPEYATTLYAAGKLKRPVRWIAERSEGFISDDHGRDHVTKVRLALDADHRFLALETDTISNLGAYLSNFAPFVATEAGHRMLNGLYTFEKIYARVRGVFTNTVPIDAYRGAGRPEAAFIVERMVDHAARTLGVDPADLRRKNFIPPDAMPYQTATGLTYDSGDFARNLDEALEIARRGPAFPGPSARAGPSGGGLSCSGLGIREPYDFEGLPGGIARGVDRFSQIDGGRARCVYRAEIRQPRPKYRPGGTRGPPTSRSVGGASRAVRSRVSIEGFVAGAGIYSETGSPTRRRARGRARGRSGSAGPEGGSPRRRSFKVQKKGPGGAQPAAEGCWGVPRPPTVVFGGWAGIPFPIVVWHPTTCGHFAVRSRGNIWAGDNAIRRRPATSICWPAGQLTFPNGGTNPHRELEKDPDASLPGGWMEAS